ncbi:hypothetical protein BY457_1069 [Marinilabilia salmonicolor]|uniref:hypothetical protein n=1 Tax=Marinilabilia salmonicolor TaxID=989 RepID=UPI000D057624|nr:hypothetical protein [Marinilabilia salmonicolor]PRZ00185.1 hypothetical protein BY457_1069 [Marinilabilia salmonicolor]
MEKISIDVIDKEDYLVMFYDNSLIYINYYFYRKEFEVVKLVVDPVPSDEAEVAEVVFTYVTNRHEERAFPYSARGITYKEAHLSIENSENDIIDDFFK